MESFSIRAFVHPPVVSHELACPPSPRVDLLFDHLGGLFERAAHLRVEPVHVGVDDGGVSALQGAPGPPLLVAGEREVLVGVQDAVSESGYGFEGVVVALCVFFGGAAQGDADGVAVVVGVQAEGVPHGAVGEDAVFGEGGQQCVQGAPACGAAVGWWEVGHVCSPLFLVCVFLVVLIFYSMRVW
jgi:hypothetical protein